MIRAHVATVSVAHLAAVLAGHDYRCDDITAQPAPIDAPVVCEVVATAGGMAAIAADVDSFVLWQEDFGDEE